VRAATLSKSAYERMQHLPLARKAGWSDQDIQRIEQGMGEDQRTNAILRFVDECVRDVRVSDHTFSEVRACFSDTQIAELTLLIGHYMMTARFLETLDVDLDEGATSWDNLSTK
jgi:alkylhydroperoxidase family enzyme